jgi:protein-S-isoprenylcysteine O-methyltransferase Ste14
MNSILSWHYLRLLWLAWVIYWFLSALRAKPVARKESGAKRFAYLIIVVAAAIVMSEPRLQSAFLEQRFLPDSLALRATGFAVALAGWGITIWAREHLGQYWSGRVAIKMDHQLIESGPYAYVRHPIYSGVILALLGTALVSGEWRTLIAVAVLIIVLADKARREEALLTDHFGDLYRRYREHTGALVPRI